MKTIITDVNKSKKYFSCILSGRKYYFYIPKRMQVIFMELLAGGHLIDFDALDSFKIISRRKVYEISKINQISSTKPKRVLYDLDKLKIDMKNVLNSYDYFLCIDFEMSMANYKQKGYKAEIIQAGMILIKSDGTILKNYNNYILPVKTEAINKRTLKFLNLDFDDYLNQAIEYLEFYEELSGIMETYQPKIVIWGKNDSICLNDSYRLNNLKPITKATDFIDLLKLHKQYYSMKDDIGLFKAYQIYYSDLDDQKHDALEDAGVTKDILLAFLGILNNIDYKVLESVN